MATNPVGFDSALQEEHAAMARLTPYEHREEAAKHGFVGLALSGGGIRSATFSLGILQALARAGKLSSFDYLSTVSGGGYIGVWLSAWIHRSNLKHVQSELARCGGTGGNDLRADEPEPVSWLRRYSNYLTPRVGLLSTDSLTLIAIWSRNVILSLIIILAMLLVLLLLPRAFVPWVKVFVAHREAFGSAAAFLGAVVFPVAIASNLLHMQRRSNERRFWLVTTSGVLLSVLLPAVIAVFCASIWLFGATGKFPRDYWKEILATSLLLLCVTGLLWICVELWRGTRVKALVFDALVFALASSVSIAIAIGILGGLNSRVDFDGSTAHLVALLTLGPPAFLITFACSGSIYVGLVGRTFFEPSREWWSRMNAWFFTLGGWWLAVTACAFYVPPLVEWAYDSLDAWAKSLLGLGWLGSLAATLFSKKAATLSKVAQNNLMTILNVAAFVVLIGFVVAVSVGTQHLLNGLADRKVSTDIAQVGVEASKDRSALPPSVLAIDAAAKRSPLRYIERRMDDLTGQIAAQWPEAGWALLPSLLGAALVVLLVFGRRVDVNKFSLHNLYKNRLIRCYLGATNAERSEQPFTGFDSRDDVPLADLNAKKGAAGERASQRPFHIINTALNLSQGKNLAWQERKAASFVLMPTYCGYSLSGTQGDTSDSAGKAALVATNKSAVDGGSGSSSAGVARSIPAFRPTAEYAAHDDEERGFSLGMAMATSGAAVSPSMGPATSPALAFLLTLLNIRLGRWSPNPAKARWQIPSPRFGLFCMLQEMFGLADEESNFVYLSDGGHFDNMGIYELVRRRCGVIWLVDASADPERSFADLGRAIRQCRIDFGVEISIPLKPLVVAPRKLLPAAGYSEGTVDYGPTQSKGKIVYIKPTLCVDGLEPADIRAYAGRSPSFPHQTTADQFFEESQFESYRRLGVHQGTRCLSEHGGMLPNVEPDASEPSVDDAKARNPHPAWMWFVAMLLLAVIGLGALSAFETHFMPYVTHATGPLQSFNAWSRSSRASTLNGYRCTAISIMSMGTDTSSDCSPAAGTTAVSDRPIGTTISNLLRKVSIAVPPAAKVWLWMDNFWILAYSATFVFGILTCYQRVSASDWGSARAWKAFAGAALLLVIAGALADYAENFQLLGGMGSQQADVHEIAAEVAPVTTIKFNLFFINLIMMIGFGIAAYASKRLAKKP